MFTGKYISINPCGVEKYIYLMMVNKAIFLGNMWHYMSGPMMTWTNLDDVVILMRDVKKGGVPCLYGLSYHMYRISHQIFGNVCIAMFISNLIVN